MGRVSISLRRAGGITQTLGATTESSVWPEDVQTQHGPGGAEQARFILRRNPGVEWPDLLPFTPVVIYDDGVVSWTGRIQETPTQRGGADDQLEVVCEGWQAHLSDDAHRPLYVFNDLADWRDMRAAAWPANVATSNYAVTNGEGRITIQATKTAAAAGTLGGVIFDAGPGNTVASIMVGYYGGGLAGFDLVVANGDTTIAVLETSTIDPSPIATSATPTTYNFTTPRRYVYVYMTTPAGVTPASDLGFVHLYDLIVASSTGYIASNASTLKASSVLAGELARAPLLNQAATEITTTSFAIPHVPLRVATPREFIDAANAYHLYQVKVQDDAAGGAPRLRFRPIPTTPTLIARVGSGIEFADASRNDGGDIYNRVLVEYTDAAGNQVYAERTTSEALGAAAPFTFSARQYPNPSFDTNTTGWTTLGGAITRDTGVFHTTPAALRITTQSSGVGGVISNTAGMVTGLTVGRRYRVTVYLRATANLLAASAVFQLSSANLASAHVISQTPASIPTASFAAYTLDLTAQDTAYQLTILGNATTVSIQDVLYLDTVSVFESLPTIPDRQGFARTKILTTGSRLTAAAANQIGDVFLLAHQTSPLRGTIRVTGPAIRTLIGDAPIMPGLLGRYVGDAILITEGDPDTSAQGRVGIIAAVDHDHTSSTATIAIDSRKDFLDAIAARFSVYQGGG